MEKTIQYVAPLKTGYSFSLLLLMFDHLVNIYNSGTAVIPPDKHACQRSNLLHNLTAILAKLALLLSSKTRRIPDAVSDIFPRNVSCLPANKFRYILSPRRLRSCSYLPHCQERNMLDAPNDMETNLGKAVTNNFTTPSGEQEYLMANAKQARKQELCRSSGSARIKGL